jgi:predicted RNase H-like HicB family nuclease
MTTKRKFVVPREADTVSLGESKELHLVLGSSDAPAKVTFYATVQNDELAAMACDVTFQVEYLAQPDGGYVAHVPALPAASSQGADLKEAIEAVRENIEGVLESGDCSIVAPKDREYLAGPEDCVDVVTISRDVPA